MENSDNKKSMNPVLLLFSVIIGSALLKNFDFVTMRFKKPYLSAVYFVALCGLVYGWMKQRRSQR